MYLVRVTPPMNFTFSDDSLFLKKILDGGHKFSEFACIRLYPFPMTLSNAFMKGYQPNQGDKDQTREQFYWKAFEIMISPTVQSISQSANAMCMYFTEYTVCKGNFKMHAMRQVVI